MERTRAFEQFASVAQDELLVLQAIYGDDFSFVQSDEERQLATTVAVKICVRKEESNDDSPTCAFLRLNFTLPKSYPKSAPGIRITDVAGLSLALANVLRCKLENMVHKNHEQAVLYQLCATADEFLRENCSLPAALSLHSRMLENKRAKAKRPEKRGIANAGMKSSKVALNRSKGSEEVTKPERDGLWFHDSLDNCFSFDNSALFDAGETAFASGTLTIETTPEEYASSLIVLSNGVRIRKNFVISLSRNHSDFIGFVEGTQNVVNVTEWNFHIGDGNSKNLQLLISELESIRKGFERLKSVQHKYVFKYLAFTFRVEQKSVQVVVVKQGCHSLPLSRVLARKYGCMSSNFLRMLSKSLLEGLHCLHQRGIAHGALDLNCLWESRTGFHIADFALKRQLQLLQVEWAKPGGKLNLKELIAGAGDAREQGQNDLYSLGVCLCELACGRRLTATVDEEVLCLLPPGFRKFISLLVTSQERERWPCQLLLMHPFVSDAAPPACGNANAANRCSKEASASLVGASCLTNYALSKRLYEEFDVIRLVGKGGFGDVTEVRNKLDGCRYAIKRVPLASKNNIMDAKILREVQLLSHLNHSNVVRYFNSWIETAVPTATTVECTSAPLPHSVRNGRKEGDSFLETLVPDVAAPSMRQVSSEWESSPEESADVPTGSTSEDGDSNSPADFGKEAVDSGSDILVFEGQDSGAKNDKVSTAGSAGKLHLSSPTRRDDCGVQKIQILYIQMEMCEKSTLLTVINSGELLVMPDRGWRLFREILEGLAYVHQKGFIHRDLKPSNIFMDRCDHAKIGDFGLAITGGTGKDVSLDASFDHTLHASSENQWTSNVGTVLYAGPEAVSGSRAVRITQKFDIYSLGIVLFEMFSRFKTGMERVTALTELRKEEIVLPDDFSRDSRFSKQCILLRQMLSHDVAKRPTAVELLESPHLPPMEINRTEFEMSIRRSFSDRECSRYRFMVNAAFSQGDPPKDEYVDCVNKFKEFYGLRNLLSRTVCEEKLVKIFRRYGAVRLDSALLVPRFLSIGGTNDRRVDLMNSRGGIVHLPFDLRVPFARLLANNRLSYVKRYSIDRVYQQRFGGSCDELVECAFDVVSPDEDRLVACAELLSVSSAIVGEFPGMDSGGYTVKLNHTGLLQLVLDANGVVERSARSEVLEVLSDSVSKQQKMERLRSVLRSPALGSTLFMKLLFAEAPLQEVGALCQEFLRRKHGNFAKADVYLRQLCAICNFAEAAGNCLPILVDLTTVPKDGVYDGVYFRIVRSRKAKKETGALFETLAVGGQYEVLVDRFRKLCRAETSSNACVVGVSFSFDSIMRSSITQEMAPLCDVMLCSVDSSTMTKERLLLAKNLRLNGVSCEILHDPIVSMEAFLEECRALRIGCVVVFKDDEYGCARLKTLERGKFVDRKLNLEELFSCLTEKFVSSANGHCSENASMPGTKVAVPSQPLITAAKVDICYLLLEKSTSYNRKRFDVHILKTLANVLEMLAERKVVHVIATDMPGSVLQNFAAMMDVRNEVTYNGSLSLIAVNFTRYRKDLVATADLIKRFLFVERCELLILCSCYEELFRIIAR